MIWNLLEGETPKQNPYMMWILLGVIVVLLIVWLLFSSRKNKQKQKEYVEQLAAIQPGNKVKTAGGICGIVVEVCDDNTVILETGSEQSGKSYIKMDKDLIAQTDAKGPTQIAREQAEAAKRAQKEGKPVEETSEEPKPEESKPEGPAPEEPKPEAEAPAAPEEK